MNNLKPYKKYKPSGIAWLGDIPEHWEQTYLNKLFLDNKTKNEDLRENNLLTLSYGKIKRKDINSANGLLPASFSNYQIVEKGDIILRMLDLQNDKTSLRVGFVNERGIITSAYIGLKVKNNYSSKYFYALLNHLDLIKHFYNGGGGVRQSVGFSELGKERITLPPLSEQTAIANFLDYKTAKIDRFIVKKKQLIKLLNEQKSAIINDAVTKGLNPNVKMKPSGIEWLGDIPEHWEVRKLKYVADFQSGEMITSQKISPEGEFPVYGGGGFRGYTNSYTNDGSHILIGRQGALCGNIKYAKGKFWASEHSIVTYPKIEIESIYLGEVLTICNLGKLSQTAAQPGIAIGQIKNVYVPIPPVQEQTTIVFHIEKETAKLNQTIATIEKEITLVQEYRTALIAEAVTGKIDVRDYEIPETPIMELYEDLEEEMSLAAEEVVGYETE